MADLILGSTTVMTESSGTVTLGSSVSVGKIIKTSVYDVPRGTYSNVPTFPWDDTLPTITEGVQIWSTTYTPNAAASKILLRTHFFMFETSNVADACAAAFFVQDTNLAVGMILDAYNWYSGGSMHSGAMFGETMVDSWTGAKTISIRKGTGHQSIGYWHSGSSGTYAALFDGSSNPFGKVIVQEIAA